MDFDLGIDTEFFQDTKSWGLAIIFWITLFVGMMMFGGGFKIYEKLIILIVSLPMTYIICKKMIGD